MPPGPVSVTSRVSSWASNCTDRRDLWLPPDQARQGQRERVGRPGSLAAYRRERLRACRGEQLGAFGELEAEGIGEQAHRLQPGARWTPRSRSLMARTLSPARSASSSWERAAAVRCRRSSSPKREGSRLSIPGSSGPRPAARGRMRPCAHANRRSRRLRTPFAGQKWVRGREKVGGRRG